MTGLAHISSIVDRSHGRTELHDLITQIEDLLDSDLSRAVEVANDVAVLARDIGAVCQEGMALHLRGLAHFRVGDMPGALQDQLSALDLLRECGNEWAIGRSLQAAGAVHGTIGDSSVALEHYEQALEIQTRLGDRWGEARTRNGLAVALLEGRNFSASVNAFREVAGAFAELGDDIWVAKANVNRCIAQVENVRSGELSAEEAKHLLESTRSDCERLIDGAVAAGERGLTLEMYARQARAGALIELGLAEETLAAVSEALPSASEAGEVNVLVELELHAARALDLLGETEAAFHRLSVAEDLAEKAGRDRLLGQAVELRSRLCEGRGDLAGALAAIRRYHELSARAQGHAAEMRSKVVRSVMDAQRAQVELSAARARVESLELAAKQLHRLHGLGRELVASFDSKAIAEQLVAGCAQLLGAAKTRVLLVDGTEAVYAVSAGAGLGAATAEVALASDGIHLGSLELWAYPDDSTLSDMDSSLMDLLAMQAAIALRNAELYADVSRSRDSERSALNQLKDTQSQLLAAQKLEAIGSLAAGIAHEINTPIQFVSDNATFIRDSIGPLGEAIKARSDLLTEVASMPEIAERVDVVRELWEKNDCDFLIEEIPDAVAETLEGASRVAEIVLAMKDFAHPGTESKSSVDVNRVVETTMQVSRNEWKYVSDLELDLADGLPLIEGHSGPLGQSLLILFVNAAQAIGEHRNVDEDGKGLIKVTTSLVEDAIEIRVADNGPGIPPDLVDRVFEPFFTTKDVGEGSGQGLSIAWSVVVDKHDGQLWVENGDPGAVFVIRLPLT